MAPRIGTYSYVGSHFRLHFLTDGSPSGWAATGGHEPAAGPDDRTLRYGRRRTVFLDELTRGLLDQWLKYRAEQWPRSLNPHLLITQQTAATDEPIRPAAVYGMISSLGISPNRLRQDRIPR